MSELKRIGENGANEFFETITQMIAYEKSRELISGYTANVEDGVVKEALEGMFSIMSSSLIMLLIRKQETFLQGVLDTAYGLVVIILASDKAQRAIGKMKRIKGVKLFKKLGIFQTSFQDRVQAAQLVVNASGNIFKAESTTQNETNPFTMVNQAKEHSVNKERLNHAIGSDMVSKYNDTLMFKMFTKNFTANDKTMIKKMLGKSATADIDIDDMNKIADFMYITDVDGNVTGLSDSFMQVVQSLGFMNK